MKGTPARLLRFFKEEQHALVFLGGAIRFGLLDFYRTIEDARGDEEEGRESIYWKTDKESDRRIHYSGSSLHHYYIMSTAHPSARVPDLVVKFGRFVVQVDEPSELLKRIDIAWRIHPLALHDAFIAPVVYNRDALLEPDPSFHRPVEYVYSQKLSKAVLA